MRKIPRREFARRAASIAVFAPIAWNSRLERAQVSESSKTEPTKLKLTPKQEDDVKKALDRRNQQLAAMRTRELPYDLEPAFVFAALLRPRVPRKP